MSVWEAALDRVLWEAVGKDARRFDVRTCIEGAEEDEDAYVTDLTAEEVATAVQSMQAYSCIATYSGGASAAASKKKSYDGNDDSGVNNPNTYGVPDPSDVTPDAILERYMSIKRDRQRLARLLETRGIKQRTPEWYAARHSIVTASDIAQALGRSKFGTQRDFFAKKVPPLQEPGSAAATSTSNAFATLAPLKWGTMFEDVAAKIYQARQGGIALHEFGLLPHPDPSVKIGASPDGISELGVMVEIKCPYRRKISGEVPLQYYYQIQGQLEVCGLSKCDYLECELSTYADEEEFLNDCMDGVKKVDARLYGSNGMEKGVIAEYADTDEATGELKITYEYGDVSPSLDDHFSWMDRVLQRDSGEQKEKKEKKEKKERDEGDDGADGAVAASSSSPGSNNKKPKKLHFWRLEKYSVLRVNRDDDMIRKMMEELAKVWDTVESFRADDVAFAKWYESTAKPVKTTAFTSNKSTFDTTATVTATAPSPTSVAKKLATYAFVDDDEERA